MSEYTQGVCQDGAAILKDGQMMTIDQVLEELRENVGLRLQVEMKIFSRRRLEAENEELRKSLGLEKEWSKNDNGVIKSFADVLEERNRVIEDTKEEVESLIKFACSRGGITQNMLEAIKLILEGGK
ncbi:TPA: hypothetical protein EYN98_07120 [Candidatus Poribacteria bacterium]|nr:hypothetical protein [Candidatus Poribacteria bacterium]